LMEALEGRLLLSGSLAAGEAALFDFDGDGNNDAVLVNTGSVVLEYDRDGADGLSVNLTGDGGEFATNTWVTVNDTDASDDFLLQTADIATGICYLGDWYDSISGASNVHAGQVNMLQIGEGNLASILTTEGGIDTVRLYDGDLQDLQTSSDVDLLDISGDITGVVTVGGNVGMIVADRITGANISVGGDVDLICADTISGTSSGTYISIGGNLGKISADTITGGNDYSSLSISVNGSADRIYAETITAGVDSSADISVMGELDRLYVGTLDGGSSENSGFSMLMFSVYGNINKIRANTITGGSGNGFAMLMLSGYGDIYDMRVTNMIGGEVSDGGQAMLMITVGNDLHKLTARTIDAGVAEGDYALSDIYVNVGHDIVFVRANAIMGGVANGEGALAGVYFDAGRNIDMLRVGLISGTTSDRPMHTPDPTVRFVAGGDIGLIRAGTITGGDITADGDVTAQSSVVIEANGGYNQDGVISEGNIDKIIVGTITGGSANGSNALSYVKIYANNDISLLCANRITGGSTDNGAYSYVNIFAGHDIENVYVGTVLGSENGRVGNDPAVQIHAQNDIKNFRAGRIIAGQDGTVNIMAGLDAYGNASGDDSGNGSIESMIVGLISGDGGVVNIATSGDIDYLQARRIVSGDGEVNVVAEGDITVNVCRVNSWTEVDLEGEVLDTGVEFAAGGSVNDIRGSIRSEYVTEGQSPDLPSPIDFPEI
ncbi:MAG: hypothetical protein GY794_22075, partial [bacterium]|nr:hypothetical protein [bacterium]